jgi:hypothetical protein
MQQLAEIACLQPDVAQRAEVEVAHGGQPGESGVDPARAV